MDILGDPGLLDAVIRRTNTQNTMKLINLFAHDACQLNIGRFLDRYKIFYERREREWQNEKKVVLTQYTPVGVKDIAQWLSTIDRKVGFGEARSQLANLFEEDCYGRLFGRFDPELRSPAYTDLSYLIWGGLLASNLVRYLPPRTKPFAKIAHLLIVRALYDCIQNSRVLRDSIPQLLTEHCFGRQYIPRKVMREVRGIVSDMVAVQKREQRKDPRVDFSNFFKRDDLTSFAYDRCCPPRVILRLSNLLEDSIEKIR